MIEIEDMDKETVKKIIEANHKLCEQIGVMQKEIDFLRNHIDVLTGELIQCQQDSEYSALHVEFSPVDA